MLLLKVQKEDLKRPFVSFLIWSDCLLQSVCLRNSGTFEIIIDGIKNLFAALGTDTRFVDGLPTALIKPLSGSGARGMMIDTMNAYGADSFAGRLACILQGSSDTTFYVIAVYFGQ